MPFVTADLDEEINRRRKADPDFREIWDGSREEYRLIGEMTAMQKQHGILQGKTARKTGNHQ